MGSLCSLLFKWSHARDRREIGEEEFLSKAKKLRELLEKLLKLGLSDVFDQKLGVTGRFCERLLADEEKLWAFLENRKLDLTNNLSERNLRAAVIWRKISFGTQSERGQRFVERILSVVATFKIHRRNVFEYLVDCFKAKNLNVLTPSFMCAR